MEKEKAFCEYAALELVYCIKDDLDLVILTAASYFGLKAHSDVIEYLLAFFRKD